MQTSISFSVESQLATQLLGLLESEQAVLVGIEIEAMEKLLEEKSQILQQLNISTQKRYQALAEKGFEANEAGMKNWLAQQNEAGLFSEWTGFQNALSRSKEVNRVNGILINKHFTRNQQLLNVLQGNHNSGGFYGPDGQTANQPALRNGIVA